MDEEKGRKKVKIIHNELPILDLVAVIISALSLFLTVLISFGLIGIHRRQELDDKESQARRKLEKEQEQVSNQIDTSKEKVFTINIFHIPVVGNENPISNFNHRGRHAPHLNN